jgi:hypothetical protein
MKKFRQYLKLHRQFLALVAVVIIAVSWLLLYRLGSLTGGISPTELATANLTLGWHGLYHQALYLPLNFMRSAIFFAFGHHGQLLTRLPNVLFGALAMLAFVWLIRVWHGTRTMILTGALFITSAWVLHVSRLASYDVLYLWAVPTLLLIQAAQQRRPRSAWIQYGGLMIWGLMLYIPGLIWLMLVNLYWQRQAIINAWRHFHRLWQRMLYVLAGSIWLPLLVLQLTRAGSLRSWLGLPTHLETPLRLLKQLGGVFVHLFIRGPQYPAVWLARTPLLDIFTLVACLIGLYFYATHWRAARSRLLGSYVVVGIILVALNGPVGLSLLVPFLYILAATGVAYLVHEWLQVFPINPLGRAVGLSLIALVIALSCLYNLRAYFVAWPHNTTTQITFRHQLR